MLPGRQQLVVGKVQSHFCDSKSDKTEAHKDGTENADEEGEIVPAANTLVEPLAMMVKYMNTLVANRTVFGTACADINIA